MQTNKKPEKKARLGDVLIDKGIITHDQLRIALTEQQKTSLALGQVLIKLGFVSEAILRDSLGEALGQSSIDLTNAVPDADAIALIPKEVVIRYNVLPITYDQQQHSLVLAITDIFDLVILDRIRSIVGNKLNIIPRLAAEGEIKEAIDTFYGYELSMDGILHEIETGEIDHQSLVKSGQQYSHPLVRLVDSILADAVKRNASDIHFEPEERFLRLRYRIDGVLRQISCLHKDYWPAILVRIKVISGMNIAETRSPQDGRISLNVRGRQIDFRVSSQPITHGENVVLRVLDREKGIVPLDKLDLPPRNLNLLKLMLSRPEGIILVTGPTGSGKTTTLYSLLNFRKSEQVNIMTLEDPVEYPMELIRQSSVNESAKMDFSTGIRSLMRQDPDIILVGEVRDEATAEMAFRAAMTGHQVFTTLHTNSALGAIPRLLDIGILPDILAGNIIGIIAQRLIRKLCIKCKQSRLVEDAELIFFDTEDDNFEVYDANGCEHCDHTGYKGRIAIMEVIRMDENLDELIAEKASLITLKKYARKNNYYMLSDDALAHVRTGITSLEEVSRVIDLTEKIH